MVHSRIAPGIYHYIRSNRVKLPLQRGLCLTGPENETTSASGTVKNDKAINWPLVTGCDTKLGRSLNKDQGRK